MQLLYFFEKIRTPFWDKFFLTVTTFGDEVFFIALALAIFWCVNKNVGYYLMTVCFFGATLNQILKLAFRVPRPWIIDQNFTIVELAREAATGYSFPSGHTQNAIAIFGSIEASKNIITQSKTAKIVISIVCTICAILVSLSRLYLGVHTVYDVSVSMIIALILVFIFRKIFDYSEKKPIFFYIIIGTMLIFSLIYVIYTANLSSLSDYDMTNILSGRKYSWYFFGAVMGIAVSYPLELKYVKFDTKAPLLIQFLKIFVGLILVIGIKSILKDPLNVLFNYHLSAHSIRYFIVVVFAIFVWPQTFKFFNKLTNKK